MAHLAPAQGELEGLAPVPAAVDLAAVGGGEGVVAGDLLAGGGEGGPVTRPHHLKVHPRHGARGVQGAGGGDV